VISRLERELREANSAKFLLNAENEELKASRQLAEVEIEKMRTVLAEVVEKWKMAEEELAENTDAMAMASLQEDCEAKLARCAERERELLARIESEVTGRAAGIESAKKLYAAGLVDMQRACNRLQESLERAELDTAVLRDQLLVAEAFARKRLPRLQTWRRLWPGWRP
jgi:hypothetical protein